MRIFTKLIYFLLLSIITVSANTKVTSHSLNESDSYYKTATEKAKAIDFGKDRIIAVLDTGINNDNIELYGQVIAEYDATTNSSKAIDNNGHGTKIASVIASKKDDKGITGIAYNAKLIDVKVVDDDGNIKTENIISGIEFAVKHGANVINMSFSSGEYSKELELTIEKHSKAGVLFVAAAGNDGSNTITYPAGYKNVTAVSSLKHGTKERAIYANYGDYIDEYVEDGVWTFDGKKYSREYGTSEAAAVVSARIIMSKYKLIKNGMPFSNKEETLASDTDKNLNSIFEQQGTYNYLDSLAKYIGTQNVALDTFDTIDRMQLFTLQKYDQSYTNAFKQVKQALNFKYSINNDEALLITLDLFKMYVDSSAKDEYNTFKNNMIDKNAMNILYKKYTKFITTIGGADKFKEIVNKTSIDVNQYDKLLNTIKDTFEFGIDHLAVGSNVFNEKLRKAYKLMYGSKNSNWISIKGRQNEINKAFKYTKHFFFILDIFKNAYSQYIESNNNQYYVEYLKLKSVDFYMMLGSLNEDSYSGETSIITKNFIQAIKHINSSKNNLKSTIDRMQTLVGFDTTKFVLTISVQAVESYYDILLQAGKLGSFSAFIAKVLIDGIVEIAKDEYNLTTARNKYIIYKELISNLSFSSYYDDNYQYLNHENIHEAYVAAMITHSFLFNSIVYLQKLGSSLSSSCDFFDSSALYINSYNVTKNGVAFTYNAPEGVFDYAIGTLFEMPRITGRLLLKTNPNVTLGTCTKDYMQMMCNDNKINQLLNHTNESVNCNTTPTTSDLKGIFSIYNELTHRLIDYEKALNYMLASKDKYDDVSNDNHIKDDQIKQNRKLYKRWKEATPYYNNKQQMIGYDDPVTLQCLIFENTYNMPIVNHKQMLRLDESISRVDMMIMLLKAAHFNPYKDREFLKKLLSNSTEIHKFIDLDSARDSHNNPLSLNQKIWALYGNYKKAYDNRPIVNGYADGTFKPFNSLSRAEAIGFIGRIYMSRNSYVSNVDEDIIESMITKYNIQDYDESLSNYPAFTDEIKTVIQYDIIHGKITDNKRYLSLSDNLTVRQSQIIAMRYATSSNQAFRKRILKATGDIAETFDSSLLELIPNFFQTEATNSVVTVNSEATKKLTLHTKITSDVASKIQITWTPLSGELSNYTRTFNSEGYLEVSTNYTAPKVAKEQLLPIMITVHASNGKNYQKTYFLRIVPNSSYVPTPVNPTVNLKVTPQYLKDSDQFKVIWNGNSEVDRVTLYSSFDNITWNQLLTQDTEDGSVIIDVANSKNNSKIYFKAVSKNLSTGVETPINPQVFNYEPKVDTYVVKGTELPKAPIIKYLPYTSTSNSVKVFWKMVKDSKGNDNANSYEVAYAHDSSFADATITDVGNVLSHTFTSLNDNEKYYFRVRAINNVGTGPWSDYESIRIEVQNIPVFDSIGISPADGETGVSKTPKLMWNADDDDHDPLEFRVVIGENASSMNTVLRSFSNDSSESFDFATSGERPLKPNTTYYWQVQVKEQGHDKAFYGGTYPAMPVHHFTTLGSGPDLGIVSVNRISPVKVDEWIEFEVTIRNNGTEVANDIGIKPYFLKGGSFHEFKAKKRGYLKNKLQPGEEETVIVKVEFAANIIEHNGVQYDNILVDGDNTVVFKMDYSGYDIDINTANNRYDEIVNYSLAANLPTISTFELKNAANNNYKYMLGWGVLYEIVAKDDSKIEKVEMEYRVSENSTWQPLKTYSSSNYSDTKFCIDNCGIASDPWTIPNNTDLLSQDMQLRVKVYNSATTFSTAVSPTFKVFENNIGLDENILDKINYFLGDRAYFTYSFFSKSDIDTFKITLKNSSGDSESLLKYVSSTAIEPLNSAGTFKFNIPTNTAWIGNENYLEIYIKDINGAYKKIDTNYFTINQNVDMPEPFSSLKNIFAKTYPYPSNTTSQSTKNEIHRVLYENGIIHMVILQSVQWRDDKHHNHYVYRYFYMTYNPQTNSISSEKLISSQEDISGDDVNSITRGLANFYIKNEKPYITMKDEISEDHYRLDIYTLDGNNIVKHSIDNGDRLSRYQIFEKNNQLFCMYEYTHIDSNDNFIYDPYKVVKIYSDGTVSTPINMQNNFIMSFRVINGKASFYRGNGGLYDLDSEGRIIENTFESMGTINKYVYLIDSKKIYDQNVKEVMLDDNNNFELLFQDNSKFKTINISDDDHLSGGSNYARITVAVYEDSVMFFYRIDSDIYRYYKVVIYDRNTNETESIILGKTDCIASFDANKNMVIANLNADRSIAQITYANLSEGLSSIPAINITTQQSDLEIGESVDINWTLSKSANNLDRIEIFKVVDSNNYHQVTLNDTTLTGYTYTHNSSSDQFISLKVVLYNTDGDSSSALLPLRILGKVNFSALSVDKNEIQLHETLNFNWSASGANSNTLYTGYRKCEDENEWVQIFATKVTSKAYRVDAFTGRCKFKITSASSEIELPHDVMIVGNLYRFNENAFTPKGVYDFAGGVTRFTWSTWFDDLVNFNLYVKKATDSSYALVATTTNKEYLLEADLGDSFSYKVNFVHDGQVITSKEVAVTVNSVNAPAITSSPFSITNGIPQVALSFNSVEGASSYDVYRSVASTYYRVGSTQTTSYIDDAITYGQSYKYYVIAVGNTTSSVPSAEVEVHAQYSEAYGVTIDTTNYQILISNELTLTYHPSSTSVYESYEVRLGTNPGALELYAITQNRTVALEGLNYAQTYYVEIYPVDYAGVRLSTTPAKLIFTTGFDDRPITGTVNVSIDEVAVDHISMSWNSVDNVSFYSICRSENGGAYECFDTTNELSYTDYINLEAGVSYTYIVQAMNGFTFNKSQASLMVEVPDPNLDSDGDGTPDYQDNRNDDGPLADPDGDGMLNNIDRDDDNDGMLDSCELKYPTYLDQWVADADLDADLDGYTNLQECSRGSDPSDPTDTPVNGINPALIMYLLN